jgi:deaminated glutathione amidase
VRIAVSQFVSDPDPAVNLDTIGARIAEAASRGARVVVFPEAAMARFGIPLGGLAQPLDGPWATGVRTFAEQHDVLVVAGMFTPAADGRVFNTLLVTGPGVDEHYDKIHLFDAFGFAESATVAPGSRSVTVEFDGVRFGMATCYDLRFPQLFQRLAGDGASVILVPASWGAGPGKREQWELLVRARALDATSWVVACGQADPTTVGIETKPGVPTGIGHSAVVSPLGEIRARAPDRPELLVVDINPSEVDGVREMVPVLANARTFS